MHIVLPDVQGDDFQFVVFVDAMSYNLCFFFSQITAFHLEREFFRVHVLDIFYFLEHLLLTILEEAIGRIQLNLNSFSIVACAYDLGNVG